MDRRWILVIVLVTALVFFSAMRSRNQGFRVRNIHRSLPRNQRENYEIRDLSEIWEVVFHHTGGPTSQTPADIAAYHSGPNHICDDGCAGIGYHLMIDRGANIYLTQPLNRVSYHTGGRNSKTVGIALIGDYNELEVTPAIAAAMRFAFRYVEKAVDRQLFITGHREHRDTTCPGRNVNLEQIFKQQLA